MDALDCIFTRRSVRNYIGKNVESEKLANILNAGRLAPNAGNVQELKFIVVTESSTISKIAQVCEEQTWMESAPLHIVVCSEASRLEANYGEKGEKIFSLQNSTAALENMSLAAHAQGLGSCFVTAFNDKDLKETLGIPSNVVIGGVLTIGYAAEKPKEPQKLSLENVAFVEKWGNRVKNADIWLENYSGSFQKSVEKTKEKFKKTAHEAIGRLRERIKQHKHKNL